MKNKLFSVMENVFDRIWARKWAFLGTFFVVFLFSYLVLAAIDFLPESPAQASEQESVNDETTVGTGDTVATSTNSEPDSEVSATIDEVKDPIGKPVKLSFTTLGREVSVRNPVSREIADLDAALLEGAVRHPDSALPGEEGNVFILGHSSYLPQVFNKNFQAFNGIQDLKWGDTITLYSDTAVYEYQVEKVYRARAQDVTVPIAGTGKMLTLATCNSFGSASDRFIVEAKQVAVKSIDK